jgi:LysR family transcriptional regulator, transcriptional activator of nhaA
VSKLEEVLGEKLFRRGRRSKVLTDAGQIAYRYADEIFTLGRELTNAVKQRPTAQALRVYVGVADSFPKLVTNEFLKPVFTMLQPVHVICREGKLKDLLLQLATHRLDIMLADEPASSSTQVRSFNHPLGESSTCFCASDKHVLGLKKGFPKSLHGAPALLPSDNTSLRTPKGSGLQALSARMRSRRCSPATLSLGTPPHRWSGESCSWTHRPSRRR